MIYSSFNFFPRSAQSRRNEGVCPPKKLQAS